MREDVIRQRLLALLDQMVRELRGHPKRKYRRVGRDAAKLRRRLAELGNREA